MADPWADFLPKTSAAPAQADVADPWADFVAKPSAAKPGVLDRVTGAAADVAQALPTGIIKGTIGMVALPGEVARLLGRGADAAAEYLTGEQLPADFKANKPALSVGNERLTRDFEGLTGELYKPQTTAGEYAQTVGEFIPGAGRRLLSMGVVPALTSETAGQITKGTALEPYARAAGAVVGGVGATLATRPATAQAAVSGAMQGVDDATMVRAGQLMEAAQQRGVALTWPEAVNQVTGGAATGLSSLQHVVENSRGGAGTMGGFMAQRPGQIEAAGRQAFGDIAPLPSSPSALGSEAQAAARRAIGETPEGQVYAQRLWEAGPRMSPERAGKVIQPELQSVFERREGMRAGLADQDYGAARNAPATIPLNGDFGFRSVASHFDGPDIPILTDPAQRAAARTAQMAERNPTEAMPVIGLKPTEFGQVDAGAVAQHLDDVIAGAKGTAQRALVAAKNSLYRPDGSLDVSVSGLHNSRGAITDLISEAKRAGANNTVRELEGALGTLDQALEQVPAYGQAKRGFEAASQPLTPFNENRVPGQIIGRDQFNKEFTMPPEQAPRAIMQGGPSAARDFTAVASGPAREAFEAHLTTQILDSALKSGSDISAKSIRQALRQNEDMLAQFPVVRERLANIAVAREGLSALDKTPLGQLARKDATTASAVKALFPENPLPGSAGEISSTVSAVAKKSPAVARQLVRIHVESVFNEATQALQTGANQYGGAGFAAVLRGNTQQAENLAAAIQGVAGPQVLQGFDEFLNVMSATGQRVRGGSRTAFNQEAQDVLRRGGAIGEAANAVATAGVKLPGRVKEAYEQWRLGRNTEQIARLITDPNALPLFRRLAQAAPGSNQAQAIAARLATIATQTAAQPRGQ